MMVKNCVTENDVKMREYDLIKYIQYNGTENEPNENWRKAVKLILEDDEYQKSAIKLIKNEFGMFVLSGMVTPSIILSNAECIDCDIMDELLHNILFGYIDEEKQLPIMYVKDYCGVSYLKLILVHPEIKLKEEFQERITSCIIAEYEYGFDYETVSFFLLNNSIDLKYKKRVIDEISEDNLCELQVRWETDMMENFYKVMQNIDITDLHYEESQTDNSLNFESVLDIIGNKIGEIIH